MPASTLTVKSRGSYSRTRLRGVVLMATSAGSIGPPIRRFENAPPKVIVFFCAAVEASISASSSGVRGRAGADRKGARADFSGKPLLYAVRPHCAKSMAAALKAGSRKLDKIAAEKG